VGRKQAATGLLVAAAAAALLVSGGSGADPETPPALPGQPKPFLGTALIGGNGALAAAVDAYGSVVDLRLPSATGEAQIHNPADRQNAGAVAADTGIVIRAGAGRDPLPLWRADRLRQRHAAGANVLRTDANVAGATVTATDAAAGRALSRKVSVRAPGGEEVRLTLSVNLDLNGTPDGDRISLLPEGMLQTSASRQARCAASPRPDAVADTGGDSDAKAELRWSRSGPLRVALTCSFGGGATRARGAALAAAAADRRWLARSRALGPGAPPWARTLQRRSLLVLRALTDSRGAVAAGLRDRWTYVWPRDAAATALALEVAGHRPEARRIARFLLSLDLEQAARFQADGTPVPGRPAQGDAVGWVAVAARAAGLRPLPRLSAYDWRGRSDYGERSGDSGDYLGNAIAAGAPVRLIGARFRTPRGLVREAGVPGSGLDSAAGWAVRPFPRPPLLGAARQTLLALARAGGRFGIEPAEDWPGEGDPWTAPTAWSAWALAAAGERRPALRLLAALRRAATPAGLLPERADARSGVPRSTTPLGWSHAFAILALHELWPPTTVE
jgi:hypothetical protein